MGNSIDLIFLGKNAHMSLSKVLKKLKIFLDENNTNNLYKFTFIKKNDKKE